MNPAACDQSVDTAKRVEHLRRVWKRQPRRKYDRRMPAPPGMRIGRPSLVLTPEQRQERRDRKRMQDRQSKERARARTPEATSTAVWLGANTVLRLAREWRTPAVIAKRSLEFAERAGHVARVGDGTWVGRRPA